MPDQKSAKEAAAFAAGAAAMRRHVAAWHADLGRHFDKAARLGETGRLTKTDAERMRWAAASHSAHATSIARMKLPEPPQ